MKKREVVKEDDAIEKDSISFINQNTAILYIIMVIVNYLGARSKFSQFSIYINDYFTLSDYVNFCFYSLVILIFYLIVVLSLYQSAFNLINKKLAGKKGGIPPYVFGILLIIPPIIKLISQDETVVYIANLLYMMPLQFILVFIFKWLGVLLLQTDKEILVGHLVAAIMLLSIYIPYSSAFALKNNKIKQPTYTIFTNHNDTIITNPNLLFVGTSEEYIFLYDKTEKMPIIFDRDEVYQIKMKNIQPKKK